MIAFQIDFTTLDFFMAFIMGVPVGILFPVRPRYLIIDFITALTFVLSISILRAIEGTFTGEILATGALLGLFLMGAAFGTRFNRGARDKEAVIKLFKNGSVTINKETLEKNGHDKVE